MHPETVVFGPGETEKIVTISRITSADDLDEIILRFALGSGVHANAVATGPVLYRILFDGP